MQHVDDIVLIDTPQSRAVLATLIGREPVKLINYLCLAPAKVKSQEMQKFVGGEIQKLVNRESHWGPSVASYDDLVRWSEKCLPEYREVFNEWYNTRMSAEIFSRKRMSLFF